MAREVARTSADGTAMVFKSINSAAAESGVAPTSLRRVLAMGGGTLKDFTWKYATGVGEGSGPPPPPDALTSEPLVAASGSASEGDRARTTRPEEMAANLFASLRTDDGRIITEMRMDGYVNATKMCHSAGKEWSNYFQIATTREFLEALQGSLGITRDMLVQSIGVGPNSGRGTWVHRKVAIHLAQWCSPYFAVQVTDLVERYLSGRVTTEESRAAAEIARRAAEDARAARRAADDAEIESRKRRMQIEEEEHSKKMKMRNEELAFRTSEREKELALEERNLALKASERDNELKSKERALELRDRDPAYRVDFYVSTFRSLGLELEGTDRILLKDMLRNTVAAPGEQRQQVQGDSTAARVLLPVSDMYRQITGRAGNREIWQQIGIYATPVYENLKGRKPSKVKRKINAYEGSDAVWMRPLIEAYASGALNGVSAKSVRFENGIIVF